MKILMVRGKAVSAEARETIYKVYLYFVEEAITFKRTENGYFQKVQERVSKATGVSKKFISRLLDEKDKLGSAPFTTPSKKRKINATKEEHPETDRPTENNNPVKKSCPTEKDHDALILCRNNPPPLIFSIVPINTNEGVELIPHVPPTTVTVSIEEDIESEPVPKKSKPHRFPYIQFESDSD